MRCPNQEFSAQYLKPFFARGLSCISEYLESFFLVRVHSCIFGVLAVNAAEVKVHKDMNCYIF